VKPTALVVDDSALMNLAMARALRSEGFDPVVALSARAARLQLEAVTPSLILMDIQMPETDGYAFTRELRADPRTADIPIVVSSGRSLDIDREMAFDAGCDEYVVKPILPHILGPLLRRAVLEGKDKTEAILSAPEVIHD